jgi:DnaD and phage-associated domain/DnaD and phage-associated domain
MPDANGSYVKVYLYLSMCIQSGEKRLSVTSLADMMENTEKDIIRALHYWEKKGLMVLQRDSSTSQITKLELCSPDTQANPESSSYQDARERLAEKENPPEKEKPSAEQETQDGSIANSPTPESFTDEETEANTAASSSQEISVTEEQVLRLSKNEDFSWICLIVENYLKRTLKTAEVQLLTYLFDTLHFSKELLLHLYEYCCSLDKTNVKYVQAVALSWAEQNITTPEQAQRQTALYSTAHSTIAKALALGRPLAKIECEYAARWQNLWHMDLAVILEACNRTMLAIQKADFKYIDGILSNWHRENVHTLQDIQACDERHQQRKAVSQSQNNTGTSSKNTMPKKTQFQSFQQRDTSKAEIDELEKKLLTR